VQIYLNSPKENWIIDRIKEEWAQYNQKHNSKKPKTADIFWIIAPWTWKKIKIKDLENKKIVCSIYHIDENKLDNAQLNEFQKRDANVDFYHVISEKTKTQVSSLTDKPIQSIPFWVNQNIWFEIENKYDLKKKYGIDKDTYCIGSFQRDTEGSDLISPKLSKGPDRFIQIAEGLREKHENIQVILTGKRRNYVITELKKRNIDFKYFEMVDFSKINELYNLLDLYVVSSRFEGGPQSILECAVTKTPIISTDVGIAKEILSSSSIYNMENFLDAKTDVDYAYKNVEKFLIPQGIDNFNNYFKSLL
tara:strand:+ start:1097 stop:2014 length:918 start_codon:yes stop_codon:yes gene_type:complete